MTLRLLTIIEFLCLAVFTMGFIWMGVLLVDVLS